MSKVKVLEKVGTGYTIKTKAEIGPLFVDMGRRSLEALHTEIQDTLVEIKSRGDKIESVNVTLKVTIKGEEKQEHAEEI